jgi:serine phosphatase RsbU (regulator of sigma subunit)
MAKAGSCPTTSSHVVVWTDGVIEVTNRQEEFFAPETTFPW